MTTIARRILSAIGLALVAGGVLAFGLVQGQLAEVERDLVMLNFGRAADGLRDVRGQLRYVDRISWLLPGTKEDVETHQARVRYWRGDYSSLIAEYPDVGQPGLQDNVPLQLTLANAYLRSGMAAGDGNREVLLGELDRAIAAYRQVLQNSVGNGDAAFNYEYVARLRDTIAAGGTGPVRQPTSPFGRQGGTDDMDMEDVGEIKVYVPSDGLLDRETSEDPTLGSDAPIRRRG
jgi:hypothetical protein